MLVEENLVYSIRSVDPDPDDDTVTEDECNGPSNKFKRLNLGKLIQIIRNFKF